jgi:putative FmdB family regulatory protein
MPTYEYECLNCKDHFEVFQSISAPPLKRCKKCKGKLRRRIGTGAGIIFKGSGFYTTDYRSEGYKKAAKAEIDTGTSKSSTKESSGKKTEAKASGKDS